jgi:hypothetical protein
MSKWTICVYMWSPTKQGRCVCVCVYKRRDMVHTFNRETYLIHIISLWCTIFWYLVIKIRFYVLSLSIFTSSFVLVVGIISCHNLLASLPVYIIILIFVLTYFALIDCFFVSLPAKTSFGRGRLGEERLQFLYWRESFICQILGQKKPCCTS